VNKKSDEFYTTDTSAYQIISSPNNYQACRTVHLRPKALQNMKDKFTI